MELTYSPSEAFIVIVIDMKLSTAISRFDAQLRADGKSPHTRAVYLRDLRAFKEWLHRNADVRAITPELLARYMTSVSFTRKKDGTPRATISLNRSKSAFRTFFRFLTDSGYLRDNPARLIRMAWSTRRPPAILAQHEICVLLKALRGNKTAIERRDYLMFTLLLSTGIRLSSLTALNIEDVNLHQGTLRVRGKNGSEHSVFLNLRLRKLLSNYLSKNIAKAAEPLFLSLRGHRIGARQVQLRFSHWLKRAEIKRHYSVHSLRHTFATRIYEKTGDLRLAQRALGHKRITTTEIYTQVADAKLKRAVRSLNLMG
jgi:integrase/recombinase XerC